MPPAIRSPTYFPLILQMVGLSGILQGHCVVKLGMDEDLLEQVTQPSDWIYRWCLEGSDLEQTKNPYMIRQHIVVMIVLVVVGC